MVNKLDEIQGVVLANKCDILVITESWITSKISDDLIAMPGYVHVRKDRPDNHRGGGYVHSWQIILDFSIYKTLTTQTSKLNGFYLNLIASPEELTQL
jgi:hypothetical protein